MADLAPAPSGPLAPSPSPSPAPPPARGSLIALEGLDRSGKTTQVQLLEKRFAAARRPVKALRFPDRSTPTGKIIDEYLRGNKDLDDHAIHLLFSANRWESAKMIRDLINDGTSVICDRYYLSGIVYSVAKNNPSITLPWARTPEVGLPRPDIAVFLDLEEEVARARGGWGGEVYEKAEMQKKVRDLFWGLSLGRLGEYRQEEEDLVVVDAGPSVEEVSEAIWKVVSTRVDAVDRGELGKTVRLVT